MNASNQRNPEHADVCIVGGGPAGLLLALLLARRGARAVVLEGHETFDREFRGEVLQPSTARLLDRLGLLEYILAQPHLKLTRGVMLVGGRQAATFELQRVTPEYPYAIWMPQPVFLDALSRKGANLACFECRMGGRVTDLIEENGVIKGVRGVRNGTESFDLRADLVVGADGRYSVLRRLGRFEAEYEHHDFDVIWFVVEPPPDWPKTIYFNLGAPPCLLLPKYPNLIQAGLLMRPDQWKEWRQEGPEEVARRLRSLSPIFGAFAERLKDFSEFFPLPGLIHLTKEWARDGILLIGDAAHTMSPAGAIGVNVALATTAIAAQVLYPALGRGTVTRDALSRVQAIREPDVRELHRLQRRAGRGLLASGSENPLTRWFISRALPLIARSPLLPALQSRLLLGAPLPPLDPAFRFDG